MGWRTVIISNTAKLDYKMDYLVVRSSNQVSRIHLSEISLIIVETPSVSLTAYLLCELAANKIGIIFCDEKMGNTFHFMDRMILVRKLENSITGI